MSGEKLSRTAIQIITRVTPRDLSNRELLTAVSPVSLQEYEEALDQARQNGFIRSEIRPVPGSGEQDIYHTIPLLSEKDQ